MKYKKFVKMQSELLKIRPELADMEVIFAIDDEGKGFNPVNFGPSVGYYDNSEFICWPRPGRSLTPNAVCVN
jgi:hypothetical protein